MGVVVFLIGVWLVYQAVKDARERGWTGPRPAAARSRAVAPRAKAPAITAGGGAVSDWFRERSRANAAIRTMRAKAHLDDWGKQRDHDRANGTAPTTGTTTTTTATRPTLRQRLKLAPYTPPPPNPASGGANGKPVNGTSATPPQPAAGTGGPPAIPPPPQPAPNGGTTTMPAASTASAQKMIEGIQEIQAHAAAGGIHAKREALAAIHEGAVRFAGMVQMLARQMSEPGMNYGPEITEPLAKAGQHFNAGAMSVTEADTAIETLINMTVGDLAKSPRQAPHHRELSENGAH